MSRIKNFLIVLSLLFIAFRCSPVLAEKQIPVKILTFPGNHREDGFWVAIHAASNGKVYVGLCSHGGSGRLYAYDSKTGNIRHIAMAQNMVNEFSVEKAAHGKMHSQIWEDSQGKLWFGTDIAFHHYFAMWDDPRAYPGGHLVVYDPKTGVIQDKGIISPGSGLRVLLMDEPRKRIYAIGFPAGKFYIYNIQTGRVDFKGRVANWDCVARMMVMDDEGNVYGSFAPYRIFKYDIKSERLTDLPVVIPHMEGPWCDRGHGHRENIWRNALWHPQEKVIYGLEMGTSVLFRFDPKTNAIEDLGQFAVEELMGKRIVPYSAHGFILYPNNKIYYTAPTVKNTPCHLLEYDIKAYKKRDLGPMYDSEVGYAKDLQGATLASDGTMYFAGWFLPKDKKVENSREHIGLVIIEPSAIK